LPSREEAAEEAFIGGVRPANLAWTKVRRACCGLLSRERENRTGKAGESALESMVTVMEELRNPARASASGALMGRRRLAEPRRSARITPSKCSAESGFDEPPASCGIANAHGGDRGRASERMDCELRCIDPAAAGRNTSVHSAASPPGW